MMTEASRQIDRMVCFFGCDEALRAALVGEGAARGITVHGVRTVAGLVQAAREQPVRVLILQAEGLPPGRSASAILDRLEAETGQRPRLIGLAPDSGSHAVPSVREAVAIFRPPFDAAAILEDASGLLAERVRKPPRLMLIDAASAQGDTLAAALQDEGFRIERVADPKQVIPMLAKRPADLVILDLLQVGDAVGELTAALRVHPVLHRVPILFLAAAAGSAPADALLRLGQDEYLARPLTAARVAAVVRERLTRAARDARTHSNPIGVQPAVETEGGPAAGLAVGRPDAPGSDDERILSWVRAALTGPGFHLLYQPILSLRRHQERYEALLRLTAPTGEVLPPLRFLPLAARHGLLPDLDRWVLDAGLETLRRERDAGRRTRLVVFQSGVSLRESGWLDGLRAEVARLDLIRQRPAVEFNVQDILDNEDSARLLFPELGRLGIEVCLAGVSDRHECLGLIARRPIATAKLAHELVASRDTARLATLVDALHQRRARVIAAGIEDPEAIGRIWSSGVDYIQGYFIQPPQAMLNFRFDEGLVG